ncbi:hypothetical protein HPP92_026881 [Vanilla planifolia]|uniref:Thioredoxin-like fold domain-containing protein n=1 Tax=Vanilla planifolia TaxID=51239 RepID=A0A835PFH0_VANPL|nr:hypothetical protein HPP92_026881 [Vanilla planifolia]
MARTAIATVPLLLIICRFSSFFGCLYFSAAQAPIPASYDGFVYGGGELWRSSVMVEAFYDPVCPDSRRSWAPLKQALHHYSPRVSLLLHTFALPYHSNSFASCRALHIANWLNKSSTYPLLELFFKHQESYYDEATYSNSRAQISEAFSKLAEEAVGNGSLSAIKSGFNNSRTDRAARISFKYGCSRGVMGTPSFFVNGIPLPNYAFAPDYKMWRRVIDPLLLDKE